ncbi:hypothetical protein [Ralstonia solanacearum]|uniref:hypothetical protein n=1 Tax=Ralstonia solanacearum TaxID=305 RepID=UPI0015FD3B05|nr:hypothetical protein [Ralstonia solanacearum]
MTAQRIPITSQAREELAFAFLPPIMLRSTALPEKSYRDPMLVLQDKQEREVSEARREQACKLARMSLARMRLESLFTKDAD